MLLASAGVFTVALLVRLVVLFVVVPPFDDPFITMRIARNLATGHGLVYNLGERVQASSSPLWTFVCAGSYWLFGERAIVAVQGLGTLADSGAAAILVLLHTVEMRTRCKDTVVERPWLGGFFGGLLYAVLSTTVIAAPSGLETGLYTLTLAATFYALARERYMRAAALSGFAILVRPDGVLLAIVALGVIALKQRRLIWRAVTFMGGVGAPYYIFATVYFGSPIPQSVVAKRSYALSPSAEWMIFLGKLFVSNAAVLALGALFIVGFAWALQRRASSLALLSWGVTYGAAMSTFGGWRPWYFPPFVLAYAAGIGFGLQAVSEAAIRRVGQGHRDRAVRLIVAISFLVPCAVLTRTFQVGRGLKGKMSNWTAMSKEICLSIKKTAVPSSTIMLEPMGVIGYYCPQIIYDYPGLAAPRVTDAVRSLGIKLPSGPTDPGVMRYLLDKIQPDFLVLHEYEFRPLDATGVLKRYVLLEIFPGDGTEELYLLKRAGGSSRST